MIWPFKRTPRQGREEYAAAQPPAPCGQQQTHHMWLLDGMPCPACAAVKSRKRKDAELDALADKIVARLRQLPGGVKGLGDGAERRVEAVIEKKRAERLAEQDARNAGVETPIQRLATMRRILDGMPWSLDKSELLHAIGWIEYDLDAGMKGGKSAPSTN